MSVESGSDSKSSGHEWLVLEMIFNPERVRMLGKLASKYDCTLPALICRLVDERYDNEF